MTPVSAIAQKHSKQIFAQSHIPESLDEAKLATMLAEAIEEATAPLLERLGKNECTCFWCGVKFPFPKKGTQDEQGAALVAHVTECTENPWYKQKQRADAAEEATASLRAQLDGGMGRIAAERIRQISSEHWTPEHDDEHKYGELAIAAACYASPEQIRAKRGALPNCGCRSAGECTHLFPRIKWTDPWPWSEEWDKRKQHSRIRQLEIAGALIAAEIDRLERAEVVPESPLNGKAQRAFCDRHTAQHKRSVVLYGPCTPDQEFCALSANGKEGK